MAHERETREKEMLGKEITAMDKMADGADWMAHFLRYFRIWVMSFILGLGWSGVALGQSELEAYQDRLSALEESMKEVRSLIEEDFRSFRLAIEDGVGTGGSGVASKDGELIDIMEQVVDRLGALSGQLEQTVALSRRNEGRLLRLEQRLDGLNSVGGAAAISGGVPSGTGAGAVPESGLAVNENSDTVWAIDQNALNQELRNLPNPEDGAGASGDVGENTGGAAAGSTGLRVVSGGNVGAVLPNVSASEQFNFAMQKALQNDLATAEVAFSEFISTNPGHERGVDATFWLGRVQFMQNSYEKAAKTFSDFNSTWPSDSRREQATLWIGESLAEFAPAEQVCALLADFPSLIEQPSAEFFESLEGLKEKSACRG